MLNGAVQAMSSDFSSRINTTLRETKGWSYGVRGSVSAPEDQAAFVINAPVQSDRTGESITALMSDINAYLTTDGMRPEERARVIDGATRRLGGSYATASSILGMLRSNDLYGRPDNYWESAAGRYEAMSAADMDQSVRGLIDPSKFLWVVVGDAEVVRPQLEGLGLEIEEVAAPQ